MPEKRITVYILQPKDRPNLKLEWVDPDTGARLSVSAKTSDPEKAEQARADKEYELNHGLHTGGGKLKWEEFRKLYDREKLATRRANTRKKAEYVFGSFEKVIKLGTIGQITERTLSRYATQLREDGCSPATVQGHLAYLRAALRWAAGQGFILKSPRVEMPKVPKKTHIRTIAAEEMKKLLRVAPNEDWKSLIVTAWHTGMRRNEMLDLVWEGDAGKPWIDFNQGRIWIPAAYNKSNEDQWVPLHPDLAKALKKRRKEKGAVLTLGSCSPMEVSRKFSRLARKAGLKITLHDMRRSFGSRYAAVVTAPILKRLMRHASIDTTLTYYTNVDDALEDAIRKL